ncbi:MAG: hypothetical protein IKM33_05280 [Clostridia bacterium]|nr:hypothetical protein [Clostridia bacterium]
MSKEKSQPEKEREGEDKNYIEISLPDFSRFKSKVEESINDRISDSIAREVSNISEKGRVGLDPSYARCGVIFAIVVSAVIALAFYAGFPMWILAFYIPMMLGCAVLYFFGKYEIRYNVEGFSVQLGKKVIRRYAWSEVTDVQAKKKIYVCGKRLWVESSMYGFDDFYHRARSACKGKGKPTPPSKKKSKNRKKNSR